MYWRARPSDARRLLLLWLRLHFSAFMWLDLCGLRVSVLYSIYYIAAFLWCHVRCQVPLHFGRLIMRLATVTGR
jgi:hypothetical protein